MGVGRRNRLAAQLLREIAAKLGMDEEEARRALDKPIN
jgi:predicted DsbA family dithiol-disulfide isomerase